MVTEPDDLPGVLAEIAEVTSCDAALDIALAYGGSTLHVPTPERVGIHGLDSLLGRPNAVSFAERFGGEQIYVPKARRAVAARLRLRGLSTAAIAETLGVTRRSARRLVA